MAHILIVDDDPDIRALLRTALERDGHQAACCASAADVTPERVKWAELILLDVMMPGEDGFSLCGRIRAEAGCPILFLTAKGEEEDQLEGLASGGDDYIPKPFSLRVLRARVAAHLRREGRSPAALLRRGDFSFDLNGKELYCGEQPVRLTKGEYAICEALARRPGMVYGREQLFEAAFGLDGESDPAAITEHIKNIRAKLRPFSRQPIETVWGIGYKWTMEKDAGRP